MIKGCILTALLCMTIAVSGQELVSRNGRIVLKVATGKELSYSVYKDGVEILKPSRIALHVDNKILGKNPKLKKTEKGEVKSNVEAPFYKRKSVRDNYNWLTLKFSDAYTVEFRAYDDGVAYRFITHGKEPKVKVRHECSEYNFANDYTAWVQYSNPSGNNTNGDQFFTSFENYYARHPLSQFAADSLAVSPLLVDLGKQGKALLMESDVEDYPGMFLGKDKNKPFTLLGVHCPVPKVEEITTSGQNQYYIKTYDDFIALTKGKRNYPWRMMFIADNDAELMSCDMVYRLASPNRIGDTSWIKPGLSTWDWWNCWQLTGVNFKSGMNTETYKYHIDFAAENNIPYVLIDDGWTQNGRLTQPVKELDLKEICSYAQQKGVDILLWALFYRVVEQADEFYAFCNQLGVKGIKIDFVDYDYQQMNNRLYTIVEKAAKYKLFLNLHGCFRPNGIQRTFPHVLNIEGVCGAEQERWSHYDMPRHDATLPFIRQAAGFMDYTPGGMLNRTKEQFRPYFPVSTVQGTRAHQMALYVILEQPIAVFADSPSRYKSEQPILDYMHGIPTVYDDIIPIDGVVGEFAALARKKGDDYYIGAISNWNGRKMTIDLSFLPAGEYSATILSDGVNANHVATDYRIEHKEIRSGQKIDISLASGGGYLMKLRKK